MLGAEVGLRLEMMENTLPWETVIFQMVITNMLVIFDKLTILMVKTQVVSLQRNDASVVQSGKFNCYALKNDKTEKKWIESIGPMSYSFIFGGPGGLCD
ncbi:hypothetical protein PanWU01x14_259640 [Parasponia andersonii]|uniref:Uncharacterized protein n=1 Tax=Parasponia andersonii TaxID=3476 RepID=A0A2P5B987_PARAD|nr:hypothetical protein PanWU01x14_259640 [Parasponia andersonii]